MYLWPYNTYLEQGNQAALQTIQNDNESYCIFQLHKTMTVNFIQPDKARKASTV